MIELYRPPECPTCADIEEALQEMVIAHKIIVVEPNRWPEALPPGTSLPALKDNGQTISGPAAVTAHLKELEKFVASWRRFQSDSCYIDEAGNFCL